MELLSLSPSSHTFHSVQTIWGPKSSEGRQHMISGNLFSGPPFGLLELRVSSPQLPSHVGGTMQAFLCDKAAVGTAKLWASDSRGGATILHLLLQRSESWETPQSSQTVSLWLGTEFGVQPPPYMSSPSVGAHTLLGPGSRFCSLLIFLFHSIPFSSLVPV